MPKSVFCTAPNRETANDIVDRLKMAGFSNSDISVLLPDGMSGDIGFDKNTKGAEGTLAGAETGFVLGGALGWIAGIGALAIPGLGPFIAAGPIIAALSGAALGSAAGGVVGGLIGLGIPEIEAKRYESRIKEGNILISVHAEDSKEIERAKAIFAIGGQDICVASEAAAPKDSAGPRHPAGVGR